MLSREPEPVGLSEGERQSPSPSPTLYQLGTGLNEGREIVAGFAVGALKLRVIQHRDTLVFAACRNELGGIALRLPLFAEDAVCKRLDPAEREHLRIACRSPLGRHEIALTCDTGGLEQFRLTVDFTPALPLHLPFLPRDLVPFGRGGEPLRSRGVVEAKQRKLNTGLVYARIDEPEFGNVLYVQNFTALSDYFELTGTTPESAVGGDWPELGYLPPTRPQDASRMLPADRTVRLYDTLLAIRSPGERDEAKSAWQFLDMLGALYRWIERPPCEYRDWIDRSHRTLRDLTRAPEAHVHHYGNLYFHPYTAAEYPDIMVQMSLLSAINDWGRWQGKPHPLEARIRKGLGRFYDRKLGALRRYLPNVGNDKDPDAVDSWYYYHPLVNLSNLALAGDAKARKLFLASLDFGIRSAHHFDYKWPIQYKIDTFEVITQAAADNRGQTDVGGIYAWVMLQAFELTADVRYLEEAKAAIEATKGLRFGLNYQANLTAWGAAACIRLWRITNDKSHLTQSYVYLASFFHNAQIWESRIGHAANFPNFLGATCLQDAPYMAVYECFDSFAAFERYLDYGGPDLIASARTLVTEYCRYALDRAWFFYPDTLPDEALAKQQRNGHIDRKLSFPLEDLYSDGQPNGQVGQEIYGAGSAMVFATRMFHRIEGAPFLLYGDHFIRGKFRASDNAINLRIDGEPDLDARVGLARTGRRPLPEAKLRNLAGAEIAPALAGKDRIEWVVPATAGVVLTWSSGKDRPS